MEKNALIVKGIGGFYEALTMDGECLMCKARGILKRGEDILLVGDRVTVEVNQNAENLSLVTSVFPRENTIVRPKMANVYGALLVSSIKEPDISTFLVDKMLINLKAQGLKVVLCFSKCDLVDDETRLKYSKMYSLAADQVIFTSTITGEGIRELKDLLKEKLWIFCGVSACGKSSLLNAFGKTKEEIGAISKKTGRGRHTTRKSEIFPLENGAYVADTPGFSKCEVWDTPAEDIRLYYDEFMKLPPCRYSSCLHISEPECHVKEAVENQLIDKIRYDNYVGIVKGLLNKRKTRYS